MSYKFTPTEELFDFAKNFSDNYKIVSDGRYISPQNNYCIDYLFPIKDSAGNALNVFFRVQSNGKIEANKMLLYKNKSITNNFVFFMIIWCAIFNQHKADYKEIDRICAEYYLSLGLPSTELLNGFVEIFRVTLGQTNTDRFNALSKNIIRILSTENEQETKN